MGWDSNPRGACTPAGFQDRCLKPLGHPSTGELCEPCHRPRACITAPLQLALYSRSRVAASREWLLPDRFGSRQSGMGHGWLRTRGPPSAIVAAPHQGKARGHGVVEGAGPNWREQASGEEPAAQGRKIDALEGRQGARMAQRIVLRWPLLAHCWVLPLREVENITWILITRIFARDFAKSRYFGAISPVNTSKISPPQRSPVSPAS